MKKLSKSVVIVLIVCLIFGNLIIVNAKNTEITVLVDGIPVVFDQPPVIINDRVMVPVRFVAEAMDWEVKSISPAMVELSKAVRYTDGSREYLFSCHTISIDLEHKWINRSVMVGIGHFYDNADDRKIGLLSKPVVMNGRTLIGVRDLAQCLYAKVDWDSENRTVIITSGEIPYYDGQGLSNRDDLLDEMRVYHKINGSLSRLDTQIILPKEQKNSEIITSAPECF